MPRVGKLPIITVSDERLVAGFVGRHLDFRIIIAVSEEHHAQRITATTAVLTHNLFGRFYLAVIKPFHRMIVPAMQRQIGR